MFPLTLLLAAEAEAAVPAETVPAEDVPAEVVSAWECGFTLFAGAGRNRSKIDDLEARGDLYYRAGFRGSGLYGNRWACLELGGSVEYQREEVSVREGDVQISVTPLFAGITFGSIGTTEEVMDIESDAVVVKVSTGLALDPVPGVVALTLRPYAGGMLSFFDAKVSMTTNPGFNFINIPPGPPIFIPQLGSYDYLEGQSVAYAFLYGGEVGLSWRATPGFAIGGHAGVERRRGKVEAGFEEDEDNDLAYTATGWYFGIDFAWFF